METLEELHTINELHGSEFFFFADNSVSEDAFFKGSSISSLLFELILRLKELEINGCMRIHFIHVAGTLMMQQGTDDLSCGCLTGGVMQGTKMKYFVPLKTTALELSPPLLNWLESWWETPITVLIPEDWFKRWYDIVGWTSSGDGKVISMLRLKICIFLWVIPSMSANAAIEQLRNTRLKLQISTHIYILPKIIKHRWIG